jgi:hypothetical protein
MRLRRTHTRENLIFNNYIIQKLHKNCTSKETHDIHFIYLIKFRETKKVS